MNKLKPCPFCGNEHPLIRKNLCGAFYHIDCPTCQTQFSTDNTSGSSKSRERTIAAWNRREGEIE